MEGLRVGEGICARICVQVCVGVRIGDETGVLNLSLILTLIHSGSGMLDCDGDIYKKGFFGGVDDSAVSASICGRVRRRRLLM